MENLFRQGLWFNLLYVNHCKALINPLPPFCFCGYNRSTSLLGCNAPCIFIIFLVFLSNSFSSSSLLHSTIPALYLRIATAHVLTAIILFFPLNFVLSNNFSLRLYSFESRSLSPSPTIDLFPKCLNTYTRFHQSPSQLAHLVIQFLPSILTILSRFGTSTPHFFISNSIPMSMVNVWTVCTRKSICS